MAGNWADLTKQPGASVDTMLLLTDGTVIAHESDSEKWRRLTPDSRGSYTKGTWSDLPPMPPNNAIPASTGGPTYGPLFFASAVLGDATVLVAGGEYNTGVSPGADVAAATRFDPVSNSWTNVATPAGWGQVGDAPLCVLADGRVLMGNLNNAQTAFFDPVAGTFSAGPNKLDRCAEESFVLLPDETVLAVDCTSIPNAEKYLPSLNKWVSAGSTPTALPQSCPGIVAEIGPTVVLPNGTAYVIGATGDTARYLPPANPADPGSWQAGPTITDGSGNVMHPIDAPAVLLPNGRVLLAASPAPPCSFPGPTTFFEYDPTTDSLTEVSTPSNAGGACFTGRFMLLPNGQVLYSNQSSKVTIYTPDGAPDNAWRPVISSVPAFMARGHHYSLTGKQFNGLSQACVYGDDATMATNYPIVRLEQGAQVHYCRTAHHSTMAIATGNKTVSTVLTIPLSVPAGNYDLVVVANGIASAPVPVTIADALPALAVEIGNGGDFGTVCGPKSIELELSNVGDLDLIVDSVQALPSPGSFAVLPLPAPPLTIKAGETIGFDVRYTPSAAGVTEAAKVRITSNDPNHPSFDLPVSAQAGTGVLVTAIADHGDFGEVCPGQLRDQPLTLANSGHCPLTISSISSSTPQFQPPSVATFPLTIAAGVAIEVPIRYAPTALGASVATITVTSSDLAGPKHIAVSGTAPAPRLVLVQPDHGDFGAVCLDSFADQQITLSNSGQCRLTISSISSDSTQFVVGQAQAYPLVIGAGDALELPIRYQPASHGTASATITVASDDPAGPQQFAVSGHCPTGKLAVTGSSYFGAVDCGMAEKTISICNVGKCDLHVSKVAFSRKRKHFKLINNPFPATLVPGSCLGVVIRYTAACDPECCELVIHSDDPKHPVRKLDVVAYTRCEPVCERDGCRCGKRDGCGCDRR
ncbi:MAG: choice-of-anchor D domain-containing protein [Jatrophihabitantaceae bacterium]